MINVIIKIGTITKKPPKYPITIKNKIANGKSINTVKVELVKKPLILSKLLRLFAKLPTDFGCSLNFISKTFSKIIEDIIISLFFPAISRK